MKKLLTIVLLMMATLTTLAQNTMRECGTITVQPKIGVGFGYISGCWDTGTDDQEKTRVGLVAGVEGEYYATRWLGIAAGVNYAMQGWVMNAEQSVATKLDYLNIPVTANFYVAGGLALKAGAQLGFLLYAKQLGIDIKDNCRKLSVAIPVGISYEFGNVVFDARYNFALTKVNKHKSVVNDGRSDLIQLTLGYKFEW